MSDRVCPECRYETDDADAHWCPRCDDVPLVEGLAHERSSEVADPPRLRIGNPPVVAADQRLTMPERTLRVTIPPASPQDDRASDGDTSSGRASPKRSSKKRRKR